MYFIYIVVVKNPYFIVGVSVYDEEYVSNKVLPRHLISGYLLQLLWLGNWKVAVEQSGCSLASQRDLTLTLKRNITEVSVLCAKSILQYILAC